jgi:hypothetical protein
MLLLLLMQNCSSLLGLFSHSTRSLLTLFWVSFDTDHTDTTKAETHNTANTTVFNLNPKPYTRTLVMLLI